MMLAMIADAERPHATRGVLALVANVVVGADHSACESDQLEVTTEPARSYLLQRNYEVLVLLGTAPGPRGIQVGLDGRLFAVLTAGCALAVRWLAVSEPAAAIRSTASSTPLAWRVRIRLLGDDKVYGQFDPQSTGGGIGLHLSGRVELVVLHE